MAQTYAYDPTDTLQAKGHVLEFYQTFSGATVHFKAFLTTYAENFNCQWNSQPVFGRPDPIQTYQGTTRSLNLSWKIPAFSLANAEENLVKTSTLARMLYPEYSRVDNASTISKGPLVKIKFANLIFDAARGSGGDVRTCGLLGVIRNLSWQPSLDITDGFFDPVDKLYPKLITLSINFDVLHQHTLGWEKKEAIANNSDIIPNVLGRGDTPVGDLPTDARQEAGRDWLAGNVDDGGQARALNAAPFWGADAALFPWSAGIQRVSTIIGDTTADAVKESRQEEILGEVD